MGKVKLTRRDELEKSVYIYLSGYQTESLHGLEEWLEVREFCNNHQAEVRGYRMRVSGTNMGGLRR